MQVHCDWSRIVPSVRPVAAAPAVTAATGRDVVTFPNGISGFFLGRCPAPRNAQGHGRCIHLEPDHLVSRNAPADTPTIVVRHSIGVAAKVMDKLLLPRSAFPGERTDHDEDRIILVDAHPAPGGGNVVSGAVRYFTYQLLCGKVATIGKLAISVAALARAALLNSKARALTACSISS